MTNSKPKNQLSFARETLEVITVSHKVSSPSNEQELRVTSSPLRTLPNKYKKNNLDYDTYAHIYRCISILQEHILYFEINKINEDGIVEDLSKIRDIFKLMLDEGLNKLLVTYRLFEKFPEIEEKLRQDPKQRNIHGSLCKYPKDKWFSFPLEEVKSYISVLRNIESRYPKYEITDEEIEEYRTTINELIEAIKNANLPPDMKAKILRNLLEIKQMLDNIYAFSREDIEKEIIYSYYSWSQLDESHEVIRENKPKFLQLAQDVMKNIVSKIKDPSFLAETALRAILGTEIGEGVKQLPDIIDKFLPPK
ncbi:MAG: hypothetical protein AB4041_04365 [Microcystaceae cyanobacterium]